MVFVPTDLPPVFHPDVSKYNIVQEGEIRTWNFTKAEIQKKLELSGINREENVKELKERGKDANVPLTEKKRG